MSYATEEVVLDQVHSAHSLFVLRYVEKETALFSPLSDARRKQQPRGCPLADAPVDQRSRSHEGVENNRQIAAADT